MHASFHGMRRDFPSARRISWKEASAEKEALKELKRKEKKKKKLGNW